LTKIYYFSGTGNSLWSAKKIAEITGGECALYNIGVEEQKNEITIEADAVILIFPAYAYGAPPIVRRFIKKAAFNTPYIAALVTFGTIPGGALAQAYRLLKPKKIPAQYFGRIPSAENYIALFGPQKPETETKRIKLQTEATEEAARRVMARQTNRVCPFHPLWSFISLLFALGVKIFYKRYRISAGCNGCGLCEKVCPVSAIVMQNRRPAFSAKCEHCQGCLSWCPQQAISFGRLRPGIPRYHHPSVIPAEIARKQ
jgi:ferredoxin